MRGFLRAMELRISVRSGLPSSIPLSVSSRNASRIAAESGGPFKGRCRVAELRPFPAISGATQADFSALKTAWRRGMDSNPRYGIEMARAPCALQSRSGYELARAANPGPQVERATLEAAGSWSLMLGDDPAVQRNSVRLQTGIAGAFGRISH